MKVISVNVGLPREIPWRGQMVRTSVYKTPVAGRVRVRKLNFDGDAQADLKGHGGEHRAVMVYQAESYQYWSDTLKRNDFLFGQFGENLTVDDMADDEDVDDEAELFVDVVKEHETTDLRSTLVVVVVGGTIAD